MQWRNTSKIIRIINPAFFFFFHYYFDYILTSVVASRQHLVIFLYICYFCFSLTTHQSSFYWIWEDLSLWSNQIILHFWSVSFKWLPVWYDTNSVTLQLWDLWSWPMSWWFSELGPMGNHYRSFGHRDSYPYGNTVHACSEHKKVELKLKCTSGIRYQPPVQMLCWSFLANTFFYKDI